MFPSRTVYTYIIFVRFTCTVVRVNNKILNNNKMSGSVYSPDPEHKEKRFII